MGFSTKLKAVTRGPLSEARWRFTFAPSCQPGSLWEVPCALPMTQALSHGRTLPWHPNFSDNEERAGIRASPGYML